MDEYWALRAQRDQLQRMIADVFTAVRPPPSTARHLTAAPTIVEHTEVPELVREVVRERNYLRTVIRRALRELPVPASYGPGSVWNEMLELDAEADAT